MNALELRGVTRRYGERTAVDRLSLEVRRGEILGLLGPNGAGKTTAISVAIGLLPPDEGEVVLAGLGPPSLPSVRARVGIAPQSLAVYDGLTAEENLAFFGRVYGLEGRRLAERVDWALGFVGLTERRRDRPSGYSGGMKRRLNLAAALVHDPELVLLDEPTVGVDPQSRNAIFEEVLALRAAGRTVVYTTHYMEEAERLCDRVAILDHGRLLDLGTVPELLARHGGTPTLVARVDGAEVRRTTDDPAAELVRLASAGRVEDFFVERADLEQVFLRLTGRRLRD